MLNATITKLYNYRETNSGEKYMEWRVMLWRILARQYFQKFISPNDIVLDLPSGFGEFINNIKARQKIAIDIRPDSKNFLTKDITFINCSSLKIKLPNQSVNKIFTSNFFEHLTHEEIVTTVRELHRILKPGGQVLVLQPNIRFLPGDYWMFFDHISPIDDRALAELFSVYNFKKVLTIDRFFPFTLKSHLPKNAFLVRLYLRLPFLWRFFGHQSFLIFEKV